MHLFEKHTPWCDGDRFSWIVWLRAALQIHSQSRPAGPKMPSVCGGVPPIQARSVFEGAWSTGHWKKENVVSPGSKKLSRGGACLQDMPVSNTSQPSLARLLSTLLGFSIPMMRRAKGLNPRQCWAGGSYEGILHLWLVAT